MYWHESTNNSPGDLSLLLSQPKETYQKNWHQLLAWGVNFKGNLFGGKRGIYKEGDIFLIRENIYKRKSSLSLKMKLKVLKVA